MYRRDHCAFSGRAKLNRYYYFRHYNLKFFFLYFTQAHYSVMYRPTCTCALTRGSDRSERVRPSYFVLFDSYYSYLVFWDIAVLSVCNRGLYACTRFLAPHHLILSILICHCVFSFSKYIKINLSFIAFGNSN